MKFVIALFMLFAVGTISSANAMPFKNSHMVRICLPGDPALLFRHKVLLPDHKEALIVRHPEVGYPWK